MDTHFPAGNDGESTDNLCYSPTTDRNDFSADFKEIQSSAEDKITVDNSNN